MPFKMDPQEIPEDFTWSGKYFHLTYPGHIPLNSILQAKGRLTSLPCVGYSQVWEGEGDAYAHTHFAFMLNAKCQVKGCRRMDVAIVDSGGYGDAAHPQIQPKVSVKQMEQIFCAYHKERKYNLETVKQEHTQPVQLTQKFPPMFNFAYAVLDDVVNARTLFDAFVAAEVRPRTISD